MRNSELAAQVERLKEQASLARAAAKQERDRVSRTEEELTSAVQEIGLLDEHYQRLEAAQEEKFFLGEKKERNYVDLQKRYEALVEEHVDLKKHANETDKALAKQEEAYDVLHERYTSVKTLKER